MTKQAGEGGVKYSEVGNEYFEKRELRRHAGVWSLWALGVGAVISGDFSGWNLGFASGGWGGMAIATISSGLCTSPLSSASQRCHRRFPIPAVPTHSPERA